MNGDIPETQWGLVMPFVVVESVGGLYEDNAFVAGVRYGRWAELLKLQPSEHACYEPKGLVPQLDLLAMHHHYRMIVEPWEDDPDGNWILVTMTLGGNDEGLDEVSPE